MQTFNVVKKSSRAVWETSFLICGAHISSIHICIPLFYDDGSEATFFLWPLGDCVLSQHSHIFQRQIFQMQAENTHPGDLFTGS